MSAPVEDGKTAAAKGPGDGRNTLPIEVEDDLAPAAPAVPGVDAATRSTGIDPVQHALTTLVSEEGRLDPAVLASLTAGLVAAVKRMSTLGATGKVAKAEIVGLRDACAALDAARQVSIAAYATRYVHDWNGHQGPLSRDDAADVAEECHDEFCEADLAPSLRMGRNAAAHRISAAVAMTSVLGRTLDDLTAGKIDEPRARTIAHELADATDHVAITVEGLVLPGAGRISTHALRNKIRATRAQVDPDYLRKATEDGPSQRCVSFTPSGLPGMTDFHALLTAEDAAALQAAVNTMVRRHHLQPDEDEGGQDTRTLTQRRADAFMALVLSDVQVKVVIDITVPATSMPTDITAPTPTGTSTGSDTASGQARPAGTGPICDTEGNESDPGAEPDAAPTPDPAGAAFRRAHDATSPGSADDSGADLGGGIPPARSCGGLIPGIGIVPTDRLATLLHDPDVLIRKFLLDPTTGTPLPLTPTTYRPGAGLAAMIRLRDGTCRFPFCDRPARLCDLDHIVPFPHGQTVPENLLTLCRHHHRLKHHTRWEPHLDPLTGDVTWTDSQGTLWTTEGQELMAPHPQLDG